MPSKTFRLSSKSGQSPQQALSTDPNLNKAWKGYRLGRALKSLSRAFKLTTGNFWCFMTASVKTSWRSKAWWVIEMKWRLIRGRSSTRRWNKRSKLRLDMTKSTSKALTNTVNEYPPWTWHQDRTWSKQTRSCSESKLEVSASPNLPDKICRMRLSAFRGFSRSRMSSPPKTTRACFRTSHPTCHSWRQLKRVVPRTSLKWRLPYQTKLLPLAKDPSRHPTSSPSLSISSRNSTQLSWTQSALGRVEFPARPMPSRSKWAWLSDKRLISTPTQDKGWTPRDSRTTSSATSRNRILKTWSTFTRRASHMNLMLREMARMRRKPTRWPSSQL